MNKTQILSQTLFGTGNRFALVEFQTRFNTIEYFVKDALVCDEHGYSTVVFQTSDRTNALDKFGYMELESVGIVKKDKNVCDCGVTPRINGNCVTCGNPR